MMQANDFGYLGNLAFFGFFQRFLVPGNSCPAKRSLLPERLSRLEKQFRLLSVATPLNGDHFGRLWGRLGLRSRFIGLSLRCYALRLTPHASFASTSQKLNRSSRSTTSPRRMSSGCENIGPAKQKLWNSPFSPQGSTPAGRSASRFRSYSRPAKRASSFCVSTQVRTARKPSATICRASSRVSRFQIGNTAVIPAAASLSSRYFFRSSKNKSPNAMLLTPADLNSISASAMRAS